MARYAAGEDLAFSPLCALLAPRVRAFFLRSFQDQRQADTLAETTFFRLRQARTEYRPDMALKPWVFTIAAGVRRDELGRRYGLRPGIDEAGLVQAETDATSEAVAGSDGRHDWVDSARAAIARLPESQRVVLHLQGYEGLPLEQIATVLGTTPEAVRSRACSAYGRLHGELRVHLRPPSAT